MIKKHIHIGRPKKPQAEKLVDLPLTVFPSMKEWLNDLAFQRKMPVSMMTRLILEEYKETSEDK